MVLSSVPVGKAAVVARMGANHRVASIGWEELPFGTIRPRTVDALVPEFAVRAREMEVVSVHPQGSHTLFVAKIVREEQMAEGPQFFDTHGLYFARCGDAKQAMLRDGSAAFPRR